MLGGLAAAALTAIVMLIVAITGSVEAADALTLLVLGGVILLIVGLTLIFMAVWPDPEPDSYFGPRQGDVHAWDWLGTMREDIFRPAQVSRYASGAEWSIPGWEPPEGMETPTRPVRERRPPLLRPGHLSRYDSGAEWSIPGWEPPERDEEPIRPLGERRPPEPRRRPQLSKFDS